VELNAVLGGAQCCGAAGKLNTFLRELREEKKRLMDQGEEQKPKEKKR